MPKILQATKNFVIQFSGILRTSAYLMMPSASPTCLNMQHLGIGLWPLPHSTRFQTAPTNWVRAIFRVRLPKKTKIYRECQPIERECYQCTRTRHGSLRVSQGNKILTPRKLIFTTAEIDFYHHGIWILPPRKLIINTPEFEFYHRGNWLMPLWKIDFLTP